MTATFTSEEWDHLLNQLGYGNPAAPLWFLGMEEGAPADDRDAGLRWRLEHLRQPINDLALTSVPRTPVWRVMAKIARLVVDGANDWADGQKAKDYVAHRLTRSTGDTLLLELLPLPSPSLAVWPYADRFPGGREEYVTATRPRRIQVLRELAERHRPRFVVCYGKQYWPYYRDVFPLVDPQQHTIGGTLVEAGQWNTTAVALTPFFLYYSLPEAVIAELPRLLRASEHLG